MSQEIDELKDSILEYYQSCKATGQGMWLIDGQDEDEPWLALTGLGHGLKAMGFDVKSRFQGRKLLELVNETGAFDVATAGLPVYIRPTHSDGEPELTDAEGCTFTRSPRHQGAKAQHAAAPDKQPQQRSMKPYKLRAAYRALLANPDIEHYADDFVDARDLMAAIESADESTEAFTAHWDNDLFVKWQPSADGNICLVKPKNMAYLRLTDDVAFFPYERYKNYWSALEPLKELALPENWGDKNQVLDNYLRYTYSNIVARGRLVTSADGNYAVWNTGLVNLVYQPIYCFMERTENNTQWIFRAFCIEGQNEGKELVAQIPKTDLPARLDYFEGDDILYRPDASLLSMDYEHMVVEHPSRLPEEWLRRYLPDEEPRRCYGETDDDLDERLGQAIKADQEVYSLLMTELEKAVKVALLRCQWNYRTTIPFYDPRHQRNGWFLPLTTETSATPFGALVVTKLPSGTYQGETIYRIDWAYPCARLVATPHCDWLVQPRPARNGNGQRQQQGRQQQGYGRQQQQMYRPVPAGRSFGNNRQQQRAHGGSPMRSAAPTFVHGQTLTGRLNPAGLYNRTERKVLLDDGRWIWIDNNMGFADGLKYENIPTDAPVALVVKVTTNLSGAPLYLATNIRVVDGSSPLASASAADSFSSHDYDDYGYDDDDDDDPNELHKIAPLAPSTNRSPKNSDSDNGGYLSGLNF